MADHDASFLSPAQRRLLAFALSFAAVIGIFYLTIYSLHLVGRFLGYFSTVLWPLAVAGIIALMLRPVVGMLVQRFRLRRLAAVILLYGLVVLVMAALIFSFVPTLISQAIDFIAYLSSLWRSSVAWGESQFPEWLSVSRHYLENPTIKSAVDSFTAQAQNFISHLAPTLKSAGAGLFGLFGLVAALAIIPVYLFFFLLSDVDDPTKRLPEHLTFLKPEQRDDVLFLVREFIGIVAAFFRGQILIGLIMGVLLATGFSVAGLKFGLALGLIIGFLNIIPYLGSILGLSVVLPLALFQPDGGTTLMGACLGVFFAVQLIEGWFLTPRIMGKQTGLHPVAIIFSVFFWGHAFGGILGMLLAVPLTAFVVTAWRLARRKYFNQT